MTSHQFHAVAFVENFSLHDLAARLPAARPGGLDLRLPVTGGMAFFYSFGAVAYWNLPEGERQNERRRLHELMPHLTAEVQHEDFAVREEAGAAIELRAGTLVVDRLDPERAGVIALIVAQSAAMRYYERIVTDLFARTANLVSSMERRGTVPLATRGLHRFIAEAIGNRTEVLSVLHLLDKPDALWNDPAMDRIYADLRADLDLGDRYRALEVKLRSVQESLELVLDVARDRRLVLLELAVVVLIVFELLVSLFRR